MLPVMPPDPLSRIASRASPHYTVTYLFTVAFAFDAVLAVCGSAVGGVLGALLVIGGVLFGAVTLGAVLYVVLKRAELLKSEPHLRFLAIMAWSQDPGRYEEASARREKRLPRLLDGVAKPQARLPSTQEKERDG